MKTAISGARVKFPPKGRNFLKHPRRIGAFPGPPEGPGEFSPKPRLALSCPVYLFTAHSMGSPEQNGEEGEVPLPCILLPLSLCYPFRVLPHVTEAETGR